MAEPDTMGTEPKTVEDPAPAEGNTGAEGALKGVKLRSKVKKRFTSPKRGKKVEEYDWPKRSYFETRCLVEREEGAKLKNLVHRLVYIGKLKLDLPDRQVVGTHYEKLLKNLQNNFQTEPMTGLLLVYLKHIVHILECSSDMVTQVMRDIVNFQRSSEGFLAGAKILVISHDVPTRLYQGWDFRQLDIQAARMEAYESSEGADRIIIDILGQLLKLGNKLAITPKSSADEKVEQKVKLAAHMCICCDGLGWLALITACILFAQVLL
ncbi:testis-expressed protein 47-like isoform X2 [Dreissena polymorpha]|uniref:testis-expressed protein 47-like isoform X2 n=1 Tax=Dreissena polymorpha TaxID=45954 RepID=UPI0022642BAB|nr:testis-expressed protein 47-like isoform X2 [Dreissena polymorpha]